MAFATIQFVLTFASLLFHILLAVWVFRHREKIIELVQSLLIRKAGESPSYPVWVLFLLLLFG